MVTIDLNKLNKPKLYAVMSAFLDRVDWLGSQVTALISLRTYLESSMLVPWRMNVLVCH